MQMIVAVYQLPNGKTHREQVTPAKAVELIRTGRYHDQIVSAAEIYDTRGNLKGERQPAKKGALTGNPYHPWWHDDDLNQIELGLDHKNCDIPQ